MTLDKIAVIYNPKSGSWKHYPNCTEDGGHEKIIRSWFDGTDHPELSIRKTNSAGDGANQAKLAHEEGFVTIVAAGGDGTIREVIQGLYQLDNVRLGILPVGTANVLARALKIPFTDMNASATVITAGAEKRIDLGISDSRVFALHAGVGLDGAVVRRTDPRLKRRFGRFAYIATSLRSAFRMAPAKIKLTINGATESAQEYDSYQILVANVSEYGGNMRLGDNVTPNDGLLDVIICKRRGSIFYSAFVDGIALTTNRLTLQRGVEYLQVKSVRIESSHMLHVQIDGDPGGITPVEISVLPSVLRVITPAI